MMSDIKQPIKEKLAYHPILLGGIALIAGALLVFADAGTRDAIAERQAEDLRASLTQVVRADIHDNNLLKDTIVLHAPLEFADHEAGITFYRARMKGEVVAAAFKVVGMGYSGAIDIMMCVNRDGSIMGVRVISHAETPGLGDKIEAAKSDWINRFSGLSLANRNKQQWAVKKDGGEFDQFSGATITPRAVVRAVHKGLEYFNEHREEILRGKPVHHGGHEVHEGKAVSLSDFAAAQNAANQGARSDVWQRQMNEEQRRVAAFGAQPVKGVRNG